VGLIQNVVKPFAFALYPSNLFRQMYIGGIPSGDVTTPDWALTSTPQANHKYVLYVPGKLAVGSSWPWYLQRSAYVPPLEEKV
jgi:hypothetical protein